jgi:hypothetical protein
VKPPIRLSSEEAMMKPEDVAQRRWVLCACGVSRPRFSLPRKLRREGKADIPAILTSVPHAWILDTLERKVIAV